MLTTDDLFAQLLNQPPGRYGLSPFGQTTAVILTGDLGFRTKAYALFVNGGGEAAREMDAATPLPPIHKADRPDTFWFCLPASRARLALALWFYGQLYPHHARDVLDEEGDFVEVVCDHEDALWSESQQLACDFIVSHMRPDSGVLPSYEEDPYAPTEHTIGSIGGAGDDDV